MGDRVSPLAGCLCSYSNEMIRRIQSMKVGVEIKEAGYKPEVGTLDSLV